MVLSLAFWLFVEGYGELGPAMDERIEWGLEDEAVKSWSHT